MNSKKLHTNFQVSVYLEVANGRNAALIELPKKSCNTKRRRRRNAADQRRLETAAPPRDASKPGLDAAENEQRCQGHGDRGQQPFVQIAQKKIWRERNESTGNV